MKNLIKLEERCKEIVGDKYNCLDIYVCDTNIYFYILLHPSKKKYKISSYEKKYTFICNKKDNCVKSAAYQLRRKYNKQLLEAIKEYVKNDRNQS